MKLSVIGTGYVGLVSGACFAQLGHQVICVDHNLEKIQQLNQGNIPFYEPGLAEMVKENLARNRLAFTSSLQEGVEKSDIIFIAVGTPSLPSGEVDMSQVEAVAKGIGQYLNNYKIVVTKSTVPVGTGDQLGRLIQENLSSPGEFSLASNPEFLREGSAINDTMKPERIVIGVEDQQAKQILTSLHHPFSCTILGLSFKPNTDDMREAPSIHIIQEIQKRGGILKVYDPIAMKEAEKYLVPPITYSSSAYEALTDSHGVILATEWEEFRQLDLIKVKNLLLNPVFIDGRNVFDPKRMKEIGFLYCSIGRWSFSKKAVEEISSTAFLN